MSSSSGVAIDKMFKQSGADSMLEKPFQLKDVIKLLKDNSKEEQKND